MKMTPQMDCDHSLINSFTSSYDHLIMIVVMMMIIMVRIMIEHLNLLIVIVIVRELGTSMIISCHYYCHSITPQVVEELQELLQVAVDLSLQGNDNVLSCQGPNYNAESHTVTYKTHNQPVSMTTKISPHQILMPNPHNVLTNTHIFMGQ